MSIESPIFLPPVDDVAPVVPSVEVKRGRGRPPGSGKPKVEKADKPPKVSSRNTSGPSWPQAKSVEVALTKGFEFVALTVGLVNADDGDVLYKQGPALIHELVELAVIDRRYRHYLEMLAQPGKYGPLIGACGSIIIPIAANHGFNPLGNLFGSVNLVDTNSETVGGET